MTTNMNFGTKAGVLAAAAILAFCVTTFGTAAESHGTGAADPTALGTFEKATVGGRKGCDIQSWPYIAPECLQPAGNTVRATRRV